MVLKKLELEELLCNINMWNNFMKDWDESIFKIKEVKKETLSLSDKIFKIYRDAWNRLVGNFKWDDQ